MEENKMKIENTEKTMQEFLEKYEKGMDTIYFGNLYTRNKTEEGIKKISY